MPRSLKEVNPTAIIDLSVKNLLTHRSTCINCPHLMSGRPKKFDETQALEQAMGLFWAKGYDCTGISDLESALGMGRQSIYNAFGDKRSIFLKAFHYYTQTRSRALLTFLREEGSSEQKINRFLTALIEIQCQDNRTGCLLVNSVSSSMKNDDEAAAMITHFLNTLQNEISKALTQTISNETTRHKTAWLLVNTAQGLCILSKSGQPASTLHEIKNHTLSLIFNQTT